MRISTRRLCVWGFRPIGAFLNHMEATSLPYRRRTANFDLCSALMSIKHWGFLSVAYLCWHGKSIYNGQHRDLWLIFYNVAVELLLSVFTTKLCHGQKHNRRGGALKKFQGSLKKDIRDPSCNNFGSTRLSIAETGESRDMPWWLQWDKVHQSCKFLLNYITYFIVLNI